jgi:Protein of unknown function (DUF3761)
MSRFRGFLALLAVSIVAVAGASGASAQSSARPSASVAAAAVGPLCKSGYYKNVSGHCIHSPSSSPVGATAKCRDGTYSYSEHASGTCSHHGGVARWIHHP